MNVLSSKELKISHIMIRGSLMMSLMIDGKERVCLAQISNTLLKKYSYNEIHNRRVALGINCVQCSASQLEILRNAGAMPISSRRCGMITKKEAERLVKSFLDDNKPPCLPDNFTFNIQHKCEFGCKGFFYPSRYNSSRAKCIRCIYCNMFFSPNKFIFHSHDNSDSKYTPTGNVNFNSWRKHIFLINEKNDEQLNSAWEDVKSIFNTGKRKRGQLNDDSDSESTESLQKTDKIDQNLKTNQDLLINNIHMNLMGFLNPVYYSNFLPELIQLNRNFLIQNQLNNSLKTSNEIVDEAQIKLSNKQASLKEIEKSKKVYSIRQHFE